jgi:hypothetical protein
VFLGTAFLFVGMLFVAAALADGLFGAEVQRGAARISPEVWRFGRHTTYLVLTVYAMRMAGAFTISATTIAVRLGIIPRWLTAVGWFVALVLLLTVATVAWVSLLFPLWVLVLSVYLLFHQPQSGERRVPAAS